VVPEVGDIILYEDSYYGVQTTISNQYFVGKNPDYPNNVNPLNPGLEEFGSDLSIICSTYYIPADKVAISPYKERT
jgi:signal peptidase I